MKNKIFLALVILAILLVTACGIDADLSNSVSKEEYIEPSLKDVFCGSPAMNYQYCKCAFHNQFCDEIGMTSKEAHQEVYDKYYDWEIEQRKQFESGCISKNGFMEDDTCFICADNAEPVDSPYLTCEEKDY